MTDESLVRFPEGFLWGVATSSYQIEGAVEADGRGPSIWDTLCRAPGRIANGDSGDVAVDHYHRYRDDVALMQTLGLQAYRFSVAWPRIQPTGVGPVKQAGLDFYSRLVDRLLEAGIQPCATLYHWDLPQALQDAGGWPARDTAHRFADYAAIVFDALRDRVGRWATLNEPWCSSLKGYYDGEHAPGHRDAAETTSAIHHLLLAHGLALGRMRQIDAGPELGIVLNQNGVLATGADPDGVLADTVRRYDGLLNRLWAEAVLESRYPDDVMTDLQPFGGLPVEDGDMEVIGRRLDWIGINFYKDDTLEHRPGATVTHTIGAVDVADVDPGSAGTDMGWAITPAGMTNVLVRLKAEHPDLPPVYITENGVAFEEPVEDGAVHDARRIAYLDAHLRALHDAIAAGVDVRGYYQWSLMDNFEWAHGYQMRFGIVHVDYDSLERTPKDSAYWYRDVIARNGLDGDD